MAGVGSALDNLNLTAGLSKARRGLRECYKVREPCDYQLAPSIVAKLKDEMGPDLPPFPIPVQARQKMEDMAKKDKKDKKDAKDETVAEKKKVADLKKKVVDTKKKVDATKKKVNETKKGDEGPMTENDVAKQMEKKKTDDLMKKEKEKAV